MDRRRFIELACANPFNRTILQRLPALALPDVWLVSGCLFQTVWNAVTGRAPLYGIKDYDIFYFDPDVSWDAEDRVIQCCARAFADLGVAVEVRNQARVHLWYPAKFGVAYPPLRRATDGIDRFLAPACMVGIMPTPLGPEVYAPHGFGDIATLTVRPNRCANFRRDQYERKTTRWKALWPELQIVPATD